ncbi:hypothetical protein L596_015392 [Steinernema carpocapsae]|uniref:Uncharacterized protein n=1 Tax=Steinernema carpocapsae TaxID=34508 RepID=A0A4U5NF20_STECR|nr:hypothetical protein L596_015392 [Steinernema carpocapsae]
MSVEKGAKRLNRRERYIDDDLRSFTTESELERSSSDSLDILDELRDLRESDISIRDDNTEDAAFNDAKALTVKNAAKEGGSRMQTLIPKLSKEPEGSQSNSEHEEERKNNEHRHLKDQKKREKKDSKAKEKDRKVFGVPFEEAKGGQRSGAEGEG